MTFGLQIFDATGNNTVFDSNAASGGVCIGFVTVPAAPYPYTAVTSLTYPDFGPGHTGFILNPFAGPAACDSGFSYDNNLGYPRFNFAGASYDRSVMLFIK